MSLPSSTAQAFGAADVLSNALTTIGIIGGSALVAAVLMPSLRKRLMHGKQWTGLDALLPVDHLGQKTMINPDHSLTAVFKIGGVDTTFRSIEQQDDYHNQVVSWLNENAGTDVDLHTYTIHDFESAPMADPTDMPAVTEMEKRLRSSMGMAMRNRSFVTIRTTNTGKSASDTLKEAADKVTGGLRKFRPKRLTQDEGDLAGFWGELFSPISKPRPKGTGQGFAQAVLTDGAYINKSTKTVVWENGAEQIHGGFFTFGAMQDHANSDFVDALLSLPYRLVLHQSIRMKDPTIAAGTVLQKQRSSIDQLWNAELKAELTEAVQRTRKTSATYCSLADHGLSLLLLAPTPDEIAEVHLRLRDLGREFGYSVVREGLFLRESLLGLAPPNPATRRFVPRFADYVGVHCNFRSPPEPPARSVWSNLPLTYYPTKDGELYPWQFNITPVNKSTDRPVMHGKIVGGTGGGKTTNMLRLAQAALQCPNLDVYYFDADDGAYAFAKGIGGKYIRLGGDGKDVQMNVAQLPRTLDNREFFRTWLTMIANDDSPQTKTEIDFAVQVNFDPFTDEKNRNLRLLHDACFLKTDERPAYDNIKRFTDPNGLGRLFCAEHDTIGMGGARFTAFDITQLVRSPEIAAPSIAYVMQRIFNTIRVMGRPALIVVDEAATVLRIPAMRQWFQIMYERLRKMNSAIWACFQNPKQMIDADIVEFMTSLAPQTIFIPNSEAAPEQYAIFPTLTPIEREVIVAGSDHHLLRGLKYPILIKRPDHSALVDANLGPLGNDYLRLFEGTDGARRYRELESLYPDPAEALDHYLHDAA